MGHPRIQPQVWVCGGHGLCPTRAWGLGLGSAARALPWGLKGVSRGHVGLRRVWGVWLRGRVKQNSVSGSERRSADKTDILCHDLTSFVTGLKS